MTLTQTELDMVCTSLERLRSDFTDHPQYFYKSLFERAPELREMFREDLEGQGMKFMTTLGVIVSRLNDDASSAEQYLGLGKLHASLGVETAHFAPMGDALMDTLRAGLGDGFTPELETAWRRAYNHVSEMMIRRGAIGG
ncbi:globin domain-containing protein [Sedimentitalea todarodis]|uniref:Globin domain-containing protein n=1 Tax=Sedimentitalea todarodis TaxID=1631240 RepID=A0ABU3VJJ9_9RHOB|nr:globin domain-containing protein [Sedimentitalea todarodis]MDU9006331.1 globin domain-containing protein [Sedimentitalea todarodis]